jgi:hypothetical protein
MMALTARLSIVVLGCVCSVGCANEWERFYQAHPATKGKLFSPTDSAQVRTVEYERLSAFWKSEYERRLRSPIAVEDLPLADKIAEKNRLLETLRLRERNDEVAILGWSEFDSAHELSPSDERLGAFARKVGADYVVVSSHFAGQSEEVVAMPITTYTSSSGTASVYGRRGYAGTASVNSTGTSTSYVPMQVARNHFLYTAMFIRRMRPGFDRAEGFSRSGNVKLDRREYEGVSGD